MYKYTNSQIHKYIKAQMYKYTNTTIQISPVEGGGGCSVGQDKQGFHHLPPTSTQPSPPVCWKCGALQWVDGGDSQQCACNILLTSSVIPPYQMGAALLHTQHTEIRDRLEKMLKKFIQGPRDHPRTIPRMNVMLWIIIADYKRKWGGEICSNVFQNRHTHTHTHTHTRTHPGVGGVGGLYTEQASIKIFDFTRPSRSSPNDSSNECDADVGSLLQFTREKVPLKCPSALQAPITIALHYI